MRPVRTLASALLMAAVVASPAAAAKPKYHRYVAYVKGSQTTKWNQPYQIYDLACSTREFSEAHGSETVTFQSLRPQRLLVEQNGRSVTFHFGIWNPRSTNREIPGLTVAGSTNRNAEMTSGYKPGPCGNGSDITDHAKYTCGTKARRWYARVAPRGVEKLSVSLAGISNERFDTCPVYTPQGAYADTLSDFTAHVNAAKLLKGRKTVVVDGSHEWDQPLNTALRNPVESHTTAAWQLRLKPVGK